SKLLSLFFKMQSQCSLPVESCRTITFSRANGRTNITFTAGRCQADIWKSRAGTTHHQSFICMRERKVPKAATMFMTSPCLKVPKGTLPFHIVVNSDGDWKHNTIRMETVPIPTHSFSRTSNTSDNGNPQSNVSSKLNLSSTCVDVKDSASHPKLDGLTSEEFHLIEQGETDKNASWDDPGNLPSSITENPSSSKTSPYGSEFKIPEEIVISLSTNHPTPEPQNLSEEKSQTKVEIEVKEGSSSNPDTKSSTTSSCGFCGIIDEKTEEPSQIELKQATQGSTASLPAGNSYIQLSASKLALAQQRPHTASSIPSSLYRSCRPSVRFGKSYAEYKNPFDQLLVSDERVSPVKSSQCSLQEIESFHQQFVGDLPLLSGPYVKQDDNISTLVHDSTEIKSVGETHNVEQTTTEDSCQPELQQNNPSSDKLDVVEVEETKVVSIIELENLDKTNESVFAAGKNQDQDDTRKKSITIIPPPEIAPSRVNEIVGKNITNFVTKYVEFVEKEWKRRRDIWLESNKHNASAETKSAYKYATFRECVAHGKIPLQIPFDLPEVRENDGNPVIRDIDESDSKPGFENDLGRLMSTTFAAADSTNPTLSTKDDGSSSPSDVKSELVIKPNNKATSSMEELNVTPMDLTPFLEECRDLWENLAKDASMPSGNNQPKNTEDSEEGHLEAEESTADPEKTSGDDVDCDLNPTKATDKKLDVVAVESSSSSKKSSESIKPKATKSDKSNANVRKIAAVKSKLTPIKSKLPSKNVVGKSRSKKESIASSPAPNKRFQSPATKTQKSTKMQVQFTNEKESHAPSHDHDLLPNEPLVEIYRGLSRENTMSNLKKEENENSEYKAFVNGRTFVCESLEQKTRLDICCMKLNTIQSYASNLKDLCMLPGVKILPYLSLIDCMNCRLVSKSWNNAIIGSKEFLTKTTFIVSKKPLGALATLEASRVRWQHIRCSVIPAINFSNSSYNGRYHSANLRVTPASSRREPLTNTLTTIIFENFDMNKQQLVQWIQSCKKLSVIEVHNCNFMKTTTSMNLDKTNKVMERIQIMKFSGMDIMKLAEALRFFLPATRKLHTLEIVQKRDAKPKSVTLTTRKTAEDDIANIICPALLKNSSTLKNLFFELVSAKNFTLQSRIVETLGREIFKLNYLVLRCYRHLDTEPCFKIDSYGSSKCMTEILKTTLNSSEHMSLLDFPMLEIDFVHGENGSWIVPTKLKKLAAQLDMPTRESFDTKSEFPFLEDLDLYGTILEDAQWFHVKQTMKSLTQLVVHCTGIRDSHLQAIIHHLKSLQVLCLENTQDVTDFGITGMEKSWIERLKMYWPEKTDTSYEQFSKDKIRFVGKSLASMEDLRTFKMRGDFSISNVGVLYGFNSRELTTLELKGSAVNASNSGLFILGFQCPQLRNLKMVVQHSKANHTGIRDLYDALVNRNPDAFSVELLPSEILGEEGNLGVPMITAQ
ncbi:hypothetical protein Ocin01_00646, partial [Orchesella cincta]